MKRTLFFDLDGTLLDIQTKNYTVHAELAKKHKLPLLKKTIYWERKRDHLPVWDIPREQFQTYTQEFIDRIEDPDVLSLDTILPHIHILLTSLYHTFPLVLVTKRKKRANLLKQLNNLSITDLFVAILTPDQRTKAEEISTYSFSSHDIVIGDTEEDIIAAQELHIPSVAVTWGIRTPEYLKSFSPTFLVQTVPELKSLLLS